MSGDWWPHWFRRRRWWAFPRRWMFEDIDKFFEEMEAMMQEEFEGLSRTAPRELVRERTLPDGSRVKEWGPFVYGYSITIGPDGKPQIREFGNVKPETYLGRPRLSLKEQREPLVDVFELNGNVRVIAEVPGVEKKDIELRGTEDLLTISVDTPQRKYYKEVDLPSKVDPKKAKSSYKNGILEIILPKKEPEKQKGESIKIE